MLLPTVAVIFVALVLLSMPIVFALAVAGIAGLWIGGYPMQQLSSALVSGSQSWVLLAIPAFVFAGNLMERCGMSHALVELARAGKIAPIPSRERPLSEAQSALDDLRAGRVVGRTVLAA